MSEIPILQRIDETENPEAVLKLGIDILSRHRVKHWLAFGTALGLYRDGDFIPDDTDIDIGVIADQETIQAILADFNEHFEIFRSLSHNGRQTQAAYLHPSGLIFDLCFYYPNGNTYQSLHDEKTWVDKKEWIDNAKDRVTKYGILPFPNPIEDYLEAHYGDWRVKSETKSTYL